MSTADDRTRWLCRRCGPQAAAMVEGKPKVRILRSGFVAVFLECGHVAAIVRDRLPEPAALASKR
jgi:hypothetical protein